ncbi:hypothetical protein A2165_04230 [Candidatus Curtissbacteria bacterium RBG_13_40_7]|uniref:PilN domain-containing protein n=1 Tax=Candidatus Curtissbacteria bacterium RBG_13_40_7 TaxID=1797706 RepID=A0A1F5FUC5_9BACT|nr:MAG: hypothetical protein A2165_04230 [Candidatus Curtissbacteria bacterium RBG_13_40_7]
MAEINLLPLEEKANEQFLLLSKRISIASIILLVFTAIFALGTLAYYSSLAAKRSELVNQLEVRSQEIESLKASEELIVVVSEKASAADQILSTRFNHGEIFNSLTEIIPKDVYFTDIRFSGDKTAISGKAKTYADVAGLVSSFLSEEGNKIFSNISIDSLSSDESGEFAFSITAQLVPK